MELEEIREILPRIKGKRVLLQIPEGLKDRVEEIENILKGSAREVVTIVEPSWGACDIRTDYLKYTGADIVVHIGHEEMLSLPNVIYVHWRREADVVAVKRALEKILEDFNPVCLFTTINFSHLLPLLQREGVIIGKRGNRTRRPGIVLGCDADTCRVKAEADVYVGDGYFHPMTVWLNNRRPLFAIRPDGSVEELNFEKVLRRRLAILSMAEGKKVGIIVSTKLGQNRNSLAWELKKLAEEKGYKASLYVSDYLYPEYLEGLPDDFFVYTGCPRVPIDDMENYKKPLLTPEEFLYKLGILKDYRLGWITQLPRAGSAE